jgi:hypothetical protein
MFHSRIATFDGITGAVIELFPGGAADGQIASEPNGAIGEALADIDDLAVGMGVSLEGTFGGRVEGRIEADQGFGPVAAGLLTAPLVALTAGIKAVGGKGLAEGAQGPAAVVVATQEPVGFIGIGGVLA